MGVLHPEALFSTCLVAFSPREKCPCHKHVYSKRRLPASCLLVLLSRFLGNGPPSFFPLGGEPQKTCFRGIHWESQAAFLPSTWRWGILSQNAFLNMPSSGPLGILVSRAKSCF